jgi:hypothetical protein
MQFDRSNTICYRCGDRGHIAIECTRRAPSNHREEETLKLRMFRIADKDLFQDHSANVKDAENKFDNGIYVKARIEGYETYALLDTGGNRSSISLELYKLLKNKGKLAPVSNKVKIKGENVNQADIEVHGRTTAEIEIDGLTALIVLYVIKGQEGLIIGQEFLSRHNAVIETGKKRIRWETYESYLYDEDPLNGKHTNKFEKASGYHSTANPESPPPLEDITDYQELYRTEKESQSQWLDNMDHYLAKTERICRSLEEKQKQSTEFLQEIRQNIWG